FDQSFVPIGPVEDEKMIGKMNKKAAGMDEEEIIKEPESTKEEIKKEEGIRKRKFGTRKKMKSRKRRYRQDTSKNDNDDELRLCLTIAPDDNKEVDYETLDRKYPIIEWKSEYLTTRPQFDETKDLEEVYLNVVTRSNGQRRYFSTLMGVLSIFDREDMNVVYQLVMDIYQGEIPKGFDRILWGDLMIMFNPSDEDQFWSSQQDWKVVSWKLHGSLGVHTIMTKEGLVIHMLVEQKYPLKKEVKELASPKQTALGKDNSNSLIVDSLLKTIWLSIHLVVYNEELAILEQTATGKGTSNPFMADQRGSTVIPESSPLFTNIPQSSHTFTPIPIQSTPIPPPITTTINPLSTLPDFASIFCFNDRIVALEKDVAEHKKDPLHTQVTSLVDSHLDIRFGETREEFMNFLSESLTARIKEQVKDQLPQILPQEVSNSAPPSTYEAASSLAEFELKKILIHKMEKSESYLAAPEHRDCYDGLKKSYALDQDFFHSYDVYSLKRSREDKDKDEDPFAGSDRGLKKRKTSKDPEPTTTSKRKDSASSSSKGTKSQPTSSGKSVQTEEPVFEVGDSDMPQDQGGNQDDNADEPRTETISRQDWFKKLAPP
ncbi:hypothetical protein Tco_1395502, partial [Tanacetum coccineum]